MTLLSRHRRYMGAMVAGIVGLLLLSNLIPDPMGRFTLRTPIAPEWGWSQKLHAMFRNAGEYVHDNFGFRASLPLLRRALREDVRSPDSRYIYAGRDGQLFWGRESTPEQSAGALVRPAAVARFVAMIGEMQRRLAPLGTKLVVALPPNAQSVELEALPAWNDLLTYPTTEYQMAMDGLKAEGVTVVDLRAILRQAPRPRYLLTDSHWNRRTSLMAFNAVMAAAGHADWQVDAAQALGPLRETRPGDLLRTMRMPPDVKEEEFQFILKSGAEKPRPDPALTHHNEHFAFRSVVYDYKREGPRVLIMGDSFSALIWPNLFANANASVVGWMHASARVTGSCDFNFHDVERFKPDLLIYARTERFFPCLGEDWPVGLPAPAEGAFRPGVAP